eukprot:jgi/Chrzof1/3213/Cz12g16070.t1_LHC6[v5.2]
MASLMLSKSAFVSGRVATKSVRASPRAAVVARAANRPTWYPGATPPSHLDGTMLGDYGFDPLRLATNPDRMKWFRAAELYNGQWAMLGVVGCLASDLLGLQKWWLAGAEPTAIDLKALVAIEIAAFTFLETRRYNHLQKTGEHLFLGIPFDPAGMASDETRLKELKNGRLAMLAWLGFASVAAVRGMGPIEALNLHIADPWHQNIYETEVGPETCVAVGLLSVWPIIIEATKSLEKGKESVPVFPWNEPWNAQEDKDKVVGTGV